MEFTLAKIKDFNEVQNLYWNLIDQSKDELSFPDWKKGEHPSPDLIMDSIKQEHLYVLKDEGIIKACAICNCLAKLKILYFDAHGDINSPEELESKLFYGMLLRCLLKGSESSAFPIVKYGITPEQMNCWNI